MSETFLADGGYGEFNGGTSDIMVNIKNFVSKHWVGFLIGVLFAVIIIISLNYKRIITLKQEPRVAKEGLQYLGASMNSLRDDTGYPNTETPQEISQRSGSSHKADHLTGTSRTQDGYYPNTSMVTPVSTVPVVKPVSTFKNKFASKEHMQTPEDKMMAKINRSR
jgi:hypothetical protein